MKNTIVEKHPYLDPTMKKPPNNKMIMNSTDVSSDHPQCVSRD